MAVIKLALWRMENGLSRPQAHGPEGASETWEVGAPLIKDGSGNLDQAATEPVDEIVGIADCPAKGVTGEDRIYIPASENTIFVGSIGTSTSAGDIAAANLFEEYPLQKSGEDWFVDKTDQSNPCVYIVELIDAVGTTNGRVAFKFIDTALRSSDA